MCSKSYSAPKPKPLPPPPPPGNEMATGPVIDEGYGVQQKLIDLRNTNSLIVPYKPIKGPKPPPKPLITPRNVNDWTTRTPGYWDLPEAEREWILREQRRRQHTKISFDDIVKPPRRNDMWIDNDSRGP